MGKDVIKIVIGLALVIGISWVVSYLNRPKIAYVRSQELVYGYDGTKEAMSKFNAQKEQWQANVDTLELNFQKAINDYNSRYSKLTAAERVEMESRLSSQEQQFQSYSKAIADKIAKQDDEAMQAVLNQINAFVENYSKENGYDIVMGTTLSGSVLYGKEELDITEELLVVLNKNYNGE